MARRGDEAMQWLADARRGSREALGQALEACRCYLVLIAHHELGPELQAKAGASDLVQEAFLEVQRDFDRFQGTTEEEWLAWLRQLLLNRLANFRRRFRQQKRSVQREVALEGDSSSAERGGGLAASDPSPSAQVLAGEQALALEQALGRLPDDYRQVIQLRYHQHLSFEEIGQHLQRTANAARKLWWRAVERLQQELDTPS
jgi:RNA polymerase sigma-70 factor (ECF subfamily)